VGVFLFGALVGAGLALLFAPQSGEETRAQVRRTARRAKRSARRMADTGREKVREMTDAGREKVEEIARSGKAAARDARDAIEERLARHRASRDESFDGEDDGV
jgi:gas vesicle protein